MRLLSSRVLEAEGFKMNSYGGYLWAKNEMDLLLLDKDTNGFYIAYPYSADKAWPRPLRYWEELAPILAAVRVGME